MTSRPLLIVLAGRPGTGKTTLGRRLAAELQAAYVRVDAVETAVIRCGLAQHPVGEVGYVAAHAITAGNLELGTSVVVDAVNPVPEARSGWHYLGEIAQLVVFETALRDEEEHRRRVTARRPDMPGQHIPTWGDVVTAGYVPWDDQRDGARHVIDMTDTEGGVTQCLRHLQDLRHGAPIGS